MRKKSRQDGILFLNCLKKKMIKTNHAINKGRFIISIAEMCFKNKLGADLDLNSYVTTTRI